MDRPVRCSGQKKPDIDRALSVWQPKRMKTDHNDVRLGQRVGVAIRASVRERRSIQGDNDTGKGENNYLRLTAGHVTVWKWRKS